MKKLLLALFLFSLSLCLFSQEEQYLLTREKKSFSLSSLSLFDNYLSPLKYKGVGFRFEQERSKLLSSQYLDYSTRNRFRLKYGHTYNPAYTASMMYAGLNCDWGAYWHCKPPIPNLQVLVGAFADLGFSVKYQSRNGNNPVNIDLGTNLNFSISAIYNLPIPRWNRTLRMQALIESPFAGLMYVGRSGLSYYEKSIERKMGSLLHFSSFHNKQALNIACSFEIPVGPASWLIGLAYDDLAYKGNDLVFKERGMLLSLGYVRNLYFFSRKHPAPANFTGF